MFQFSGFNMIFPERSRTFKASYKCLSVSMLPGNERQVLEKGGKIIIPPSALDALTRFNVEYPMLFNLINAEKDRHSHAGVLEFVADEENCYLPLWMMDNLLLEEGDTINIESVSLPIAKFSKFHPNSVDFLDITNPKAVLENALRNFACLTAGDVIAIKYNKKIYELSVLETKPGNAVSIIECDINVEFEAPVGYKETSDQNEDNAQDDPQQSHVMEDVVETFKCSGVRLDRKRKNESQFDSPVIKKIRFGVLTFDRGVKAISDRIPEVEQCE
uniref:Ubiquitin fusion degradation protein 1 homolog n=1 Tax=Glossina brevipalpis TaxID=37001 RepID=A0A1A9W6V6_9MUSC